MTSNHEQNSNDTTLENLKRTNILSLYVSLKKK